MTVRARLLCSLPLLLTLALLPACGGDDATGPEASPSSGELTVVLESRTQERVDVWQTEEHQISFCYADSPCIGYLEAEGVESSLRGAGGEGNVTVLHTSEENREATGAIVELEVERDGTGVVHVLEGRIEDDPVLSMDDLDSGDILDSSDPFTGGDVVSLEVGVTE